MSNILDNYIGIHSQALQVRTKKTELLAANLANADTPGYKAKDIDFRKALSNVGTERLDRTHSQHFEFGDQGAGRVQYRIPTQPSVDGNTVEEHVEQAEFLDNAVRYQATVQFLGGKLNSLKSAFKGE
ncbi:MAG: flagellar basal body rod protein FlgB [Gammaproteobacteria bacterium]|jgi:flagellar basal-body rod protein FlgB|nr:flagellar basal body rod protein FlgB [Gammaproteobacteria bacterium]MBT3490623.1 flagellar basal body rod protein FlgB [Gammaproteobacteria bacterium]MBT3718025.1 flagellar basal body rod protein FlgB [Gammaproteobacteria bacterium]MBT3844890.1 flagellar basal body rod protein FlgB [Gammaproteobacteria bacterium]MBT3891970.1 flagellar basal body rod protein FlgB [Gammaproteobacteria bacterium]